MWLVYRISVWQTNDDQPLFPDAAAGARPLGRQGELHEGKTLSSLIEAAARETIQRRRFEEQFVARGLRAREHPQRTGACPTAEAVDAHILAVLAFAARLVHTKRIAATGGCSAHASS